MGLPSFCTYINDSQSENCKMCGTKRSADKNVSYEPMDIKITLKDGDTRDITNKIEEAMKKKKYMRKI